jgi:hypothetical protein
MHQEDFLSILRTEFIVPEVSQVERGVSYFVQRRR